MDATGGRLKASLGPVWDSRLCHLSSGSHMHKAVKMKAALCTYSELGGRSSRGTLLAWSLESQGLLQRQTHTRLLETRGDAGPSRRHRLSVQRPSTFSHVNAPRSTQRFHFVMELCCFLSPQTSGNDRSEQIRTDLLCVSRGSVDFYPL